jgi:hypothetical protein
VIFDLHLPKKCWPFAKSVFSELARINSVAQIWGHSQENGDGVGFTTRLSLAWIMGVRFLSDETA